MAEVVTLPQGTINLATQQWKKKILSHFYHNSFIGNNFSSEYSFAGEKGITILNTVTQPMNLYALNDPLTATQQPTRFGGLNEVVDEAQDLTMRREFAFQLTLERKNRDDQMMLKTAGKYLTDQVNERVVPLLDRYTIHRWIGWDNTGNPGPGIKVVQGTVSTANFVQEILKAETWYMNNAVPESQRICYVPASKYDLLRLSDLFIEGPEASFIKKAVTKGAVGQIGSMTIVRIPDTWMVNNTPELNITTGLDAYTWVWDDSDVNFFCIYSPAVLRPVKIKTQRIQTNSDLLDGWLIQAHYYFDAFVLGIKSAGVYVHREDVTP